MADVTEEIVDLVRQIVHAQPQVKATPPPLPEGHVRFYHGGAEYDAGSRWVSPDRAYAEGYARKSRGKLHYVDIPEDSPHLQKSFDDTGTNVKAPYMAFDAPEDIARQLRPYENAVRHQRPGASQSRSKPRTLKPLPAARTPAPSGNAEESGARPHSRSEPLRHTRPAPAKAAPAIPRAVPPRQIPAATTTDSTSRNRMLGFLRHASSLARGNRRNIQRNLRHGLRGARKLLRSIVPAMVPQAPREMLPPAQPTTPAAPRSIPAAVPETVPAAPRSIPAAVPVAKQSQKARPPKQAAIHAGQGKRSRPPERLKRAEAKFQRQMQHGPKRMPTARPVRLKAAEAHFRERQQYGMRTLEPLPTARAARLKHREADFQERLRHGKPRSAPPVGATWERNRPSRSKMGEWLFRNKHQRKGAEAAAIRGMVSPSQPTRPAGIGNPLGAGSDSLSQEEIRLLREAVGYLRVIAEEGKKRDTGQLPPEESAAPSHAAAAHIAGMGSPGATSDHATSSLLKHLKTASKAYSVIRGAMQLAKVIP